MRDNITPDHKLLSRTELDTIKKQTPFCEKSCPCVIKLLSQIHFSKKISKQIRDLKMRSTAKLHSNVEIFFLQTYSGISKQLLIVSEVSFPNNFFYTFALTL